MDFVFLLSFLGGFIAQFDEDIIKNRFKRWMEIIVVLFVPGFIPILFFLSKNHLP